MYRIQQDNKKNSIQFDAGKYIKYCFKHWISIVASGLLTAIIAFLITFILITPQYEASVIVYVNNIKSNQAIETITGSALSAAQQLVNTYVNIIKSDTVLDEVIDRGNLGCSAKDIRDIMKTQQIEDTEMFVVSIRHQDPEMAMHIANTIADVAPNRISKFVRGSSTEIIDYAKEPQTPCSPSYPKNIIISGLFGCICTGILLTVRFFFDMRIKSEEDVITYLKLPVLGIIPENNVEEKWKGRR